jgi:hypothetical protein
MAHLTAPVHHKEPCALCLQKLLQQPSHANTPDRGMLSSETPSMPVSDHRQQMPSACLRLVYMCQELASMPEAAYMQRIGAEPLA